MKAYGLVHERSAVDGTRVVSAGEEGRDMAGSNSLPQLSLMMLMIANEGSLHTILNSSKSKLPVT